MNFLRSQEKEDVTWEKTTKTSSQTVPPSIDSPVTVTASADSNLDSVNVGSDSTNVSPSLQFLRFAHKSLGR